MTDLALDALRQRLEAMTAALEIASHERTHHCLNPVAVRQIVVDADTLLDRLAALERKRGACKVCWTVSWEPIEKPEDADGVNTIGPDHLARCGYCWHQKAYQDNQKAYQDKLAACEAKLQDYIGLSNDMMVLDTTRQRLAQAERVVAWYGERAWSLVRYANEKKLDAQIAIMKELELDGGTRAKHALALADAGKEK